MAKLDLSKYGITGTTDVVYNPSYEQLFEEETKPGLPTAVQELYEQKVKILTEDEEPEIETDFEVKDRTPEEIKKEEEYAEE